MIIKNYKTFYFKKFIKYKKRGPTETRTRIKGFRVLCANHYTIEPSAYFN